MKHDLKNSVKDYVESIQLSDEQLDDLMGVVNVHKERKVISPKRNWSTLRLAAAIATIILAAGLLWNVGFKQQSDVSLLIAEETVYNHLKMKPLEVASHSLSDVRAYFSQLEFPVRGRSGLMAADNMQLLGGRYCSIQGITAAQLRFQNKETGALETLYEAPYNSELFKELPNLQEGQEPIRHYINGVGVDIWIDKGILFARTFNEDV